MKKNVAEFLKDLYRKRRNLLKSIRENKAGIIENLSNLYPDRAHFIFELLQNAEDANATFIRFDLTEDSLLVKHNGRLFNDEDVDSITNILKSTKDEDIDKIGKFGVGFKAIFGYSKTPRIHSGEYDFKIIDYICPKSISKIDKDDQETVFIFPFDNKSKKTEECFNEIEFALINLDHIALLFLNNIKSIEWDANKEARGSVIRESRIYKDNELIKISIMNSLNKKLQEDAWFLIFQKTLDGYGNLKCSIAFNLIFRKESQTSPDLRKDIFKQMKIAPTDGQFCIFFPAAKEKTGLKMHVNGPYAVTVDRASIMHDHVGNRKIFNSTSQLLVDSMERIKEIGLLTSEFLEVLPNNKDDSLAPFYDTMRESVYDVLSNKALIPCLAGGYGKADELVRGRKDIIDVLGNDGLTALSDNGDNKKWSIGVRYNSRSDNLLTSLNIPYWGYKELITAVENKDRFRWSPYPWNPLHFNSLHKSFNWLQNQSTDWFRSFYLLLFIAAKKMEKEDHICRWKIIKSKDGKILTGDNFYFPIEDNSLVSDLSIISTEILDESSKERRDKIRKFLELSGVKQIGEREMIEQILDRFYGDDSKRPGKRKHLEHIKRFIKWNESEHESDVFQNYFIFLNSKEEYCLGMKCYIDSPLEDTGLGVIYSDGSGKNESRSALWSGYTKIKNFIPFAKSCGVLRSLEIETVDIKDNPQYSKLSPDNPSAKYTPSTGIKSDYSIESLEEILEDISVDIARLIWSTMAKSSSDKLIATYKPNNQHGKKCVQSTVVQILKRKKWIPGKDGNFYSPGEMSREILRDDFEYDNGNGWLTDIGFSNGEPSKIEMTVKGVGRISVDIENTSESKEDIMKKIEYLITPVEFPERPSKNPKNRATRASMRAGDAPKKKYKNRNRSTRVSQSVGDKRTYLKQSYTNNNDQLVCQMCKKEMPFRCRDGRYYFEAVEMFQKTELHKEHEEAHIALCPLCAAKFKELIKKDETQRKRLWNDLVKLDAETSENLRVRLNLGEEEEKSIQFVETHFIDIQAILRDEGKKKPSS